MRKLTAISICSTKVRWNALTLLREQRASAFRAFSLSGLVDFIKADVDGIFGDPEQRYIVRVSNVDTVEVLSPITGYYKQRAMVAVCHALVPEIPFDKYLPPEDFQIMVQTRFAESSNRALVLKIAGNLAMSSHCRQQMMELARRSP